MWLVAAAAAADVDDLRARVKAIQSGFLFERPIKGKFKFKSRKRASDEAIFYVEAKQQASDSDTHAHRLTSATEDAPALGGGGGGGSYGWHNSGPRRAASRCQPPRRA